MIEEEPPTSMVFDYGFPRLPKIDQEKLVGEALMDKYETDGDTNLVGNIACDPDPPDRLFHYGVTRIGVELTEVDQNYNRRTEDINFVNDIYVEFRKRNIENRYEGLTISVLSLDEGLKRRGLRRRDSRKAAKELVDLVQTSTQSADELEGIFARRLKVDSTGNPALSLITGSI
ncbi:hypothetical protein [Streptosporangium sp. V21-05]|uniref:hypothetical protein n=1 Tax=Streptosporangium sp. V21-05 TaxID=3446115 RepID=UPI003F530F53